MKKILYAVLVVLIVIVSCRSLQAQTAFVVGADTSVNMGERPGVLLGLRAEKEGGVGLESFTYVDTSRKREGGWKAGQSFSVRLGGRFGAILGGSFLYRDGGPWVKTTVRSLVGVGWRGGSQEVRFLYRHPLYESYPNDVRQVGVELRLRKPGSRFGLILTEGFSLYRDDRGMPRRYGWSQTFSTTWNIAK